MGNFAGWVLPITLIVAGAGMFFDGRVAAVALLVGGIVIAVMGVRG